MSQRLFRLIICAAALLRSVSLTSQAAGGAGAELDQRALTIQKIRPGDGSERDPAFARVREAILKAARRNDLEAVIRYFAPQIRCYTETGLVHEEGVMTAAACAAKLRADPDQARDFLSSLQQALEIGTAFNHDMIVAPYVATAADIIQALPEIRGHYWVVVADKVRVRSAPSSQAPVVEMLSYDIVSTVTADAESTPGTEGDKCDSWVHIRTPTKREAWVCGKYTASPLEDTQFFFQRQPDGGWNLMGVYVPD